MKLPPFHLLAVLAVASIFPGCAAVGPSPAPTVASPATKQIWDRLYFGRNIPTGGDVSDADWATFLAEVVTPRFPNGFTVLHGEGQWLGQSGAIARERSFILELSHPDTEAASRAVLEIAAEYKRRFAQEAVLHRREPVDTNLL